MELTFALSGPWLKQWQVTMETSLNGSGQEIIKKFGTSKRRLTECSRIFFSGQTEIFLFQGD